MDESQAVAAGHLVNVLQELNEHHGAVPDKLLIRAVGNGSFAVQYWMPAEKDPISFYTTTEYAEDGSLISR